MKAKYLNWLKFGRNLTPNTIKSIENDLDLFGDKLETATRADIEEFVINQNMQKLATATVGRRIASLRGFFEWQLYNGLRSGNNPAAGKIAPKITNQSHQAISKQQLINLYNNSPNLTIKLAVALMGFAGLRLGEVVGIGTHNKLYKDINDDYAVHLTETKGNKERKVTLALIPDQSLLRLLEINGGLFGERGRLTENGLWRLLSKYFKEQGLQDFSPHGLRSTFATLTANADVNTNIIRSALGHSAISGLGETTSRYIGIATVEQQAEELLEKMG